MAEAAPAHAPLVGAHPASAAWGIADAFLGVTLLAGVLVAGNVDRMPRGIEEFLAVRLSLKNLGLLTVFGLIWPAVLRSCGLYEPARLRDGRGEWPRLIAASVVACILAMVFPLTSQSGAARPIHALLFAVLVAPSAVALRAGARAVRRLARARTERNVVIVGSGPRACLSWRELQRQESASYNVLGFVDDRKEASPAAAIMPFLGGLSRLEAILAELVVDEVRITLPVKSCYDAFQQTIAMCERVGVGCSYVVDTFEHAFTQPRLSMGEGRSTLNATPVPHDEHLLYKRIFDVIVGSAMLIALSPLMLLIAIAVKVTSRGPVLFAQQRYGKNKRRFVMYKFRSMRVDAERVLRENPELNAEYLANNFKLPDAKDPRITPVGRRLRTSSLDELPQLWNVVRGEMSLVGPRPIVPAEISHYGAVASLLLALKPGMTSMWVVEGRSSVGYPRRADLELKYVRNWSFHRDLLILVKTLPVVFRGTGAH